MTELKATPGPWRIKCNSDGIYVDGEEGFVCHIDLPPCERREANAHLIAAAPGTYAELYESTNVLKLLVDIVEPGYRADILEQVRRNEAALSKARGETE